MKNITGQRKHIMLFLNGPLKGKTIEGDGNPPNHFTAGPAAISKDPAAKAQQLTPDGLFLVKPTHKQMNKKGTVYKMVWFSVSGKKTADDEPIGDYIKVARYKAVKQLKQEDMDWTAPKPSIHHKLGAGLFDMVEEPHDGKPVPLPEPVKEAASSKADEYFKKAMTNYIIQAQHTAFIKSLKGV